MKFTKIGFYATMFAMALFVMACGGNGNTAENDTTGTENVEEGDSERGNWRSRRRT